MNLSLPRSLFCLSLGLGLTGFLNSDALAQSCSKQSPAHSVALLELYTSEGCSSCPPADKYVSSLRSSGITADQAVMLSMHVDYWDDIGWKDPFSKKSATERQRWLTSLTGGHTVYTPEVFMGGQELRGWRGSVPDAVKRINGQPAKADIKISLGTLSGGNLPVDVQATAKQKGKLYLALVENGIAIDVKSGENSGSVLKHDFVVREWLGPFALSGDKETRAQISRAIAIPAGANNKNLGISAFVQSERGEVLQALSLPLCNG
jgi:hypothetical protein